MLPTSSSSLALLAPPPWSSPGEIETAVRDLASASKRTDQAAYQRVLFSIGNPHAYSYWPAALALIPQLEEVLCGGTEIARPRVLAVLIHLLDSFEPEPGFETVRTATGPRPLAELVRQAIVRLEHAVEQIEQTTSSPKEQRLAQELLSYIATRPAPELRS